MMEKGKNYLVEEISPFPTVFFKEEKDLAILQEIGINNFNFPPVSLFAM